MAAKTIITPAATARHAQDYTKDLIRSVMAISRDLVGADRCSVYFLDVDRLVSVLSDQVQGEVSLPIQAGLAGYSARTGEVVVVEDVYQDPRFDSSVDSLTGYRTRNVLCLPVKNAEGLVVGVVQMLNKQTGSFVSEDETICRALAQHVAVALYNAQLYESAVQSRTQSEALLRMLRDISSEPHTRKLLQKVMHTSRELLQADRCTVFIIDRESMQLWSTVADGTEEIRLPLDAGIAGFVATTGMTYRYYTYHIDTHRHISHRHIKLNLSILSTVGKSYIST
eukprot:TRINITY_DN38659_c0_g1_i1.p1 TRINITY_DN38659_c0_g1~~TRINITY_DN38659_c0_g1_i1.p1  ORF type:complete len:293 (+),score=41.29 TRINITY_DN38659_c0_g1_i1:34-879(+)